MKTHRTHTEIVSCLVNYFVEESDYDTPDDVHMNRIHILANQFERNMLHRDYYHQSIAISGISFTQENKEEIVSFLLNGIPNYGPGKIVTNIVEWIENDDDSYAVTVIYEDDSEWSGCIASERFETMKQEELQSELKIEIDPEEDLLGFMNQQSKHYGLCAWCRSYYQRSDNKPIIKLTDTEFEMTKNPKNKISHSCCIDCKDAAISA